MDTLKKLLGLQDPVAEARASIATTNTTIRRLTAECEVVEEDIATLTRDISTETHQSIARNKMRELQRRQAELDALTSEIDKLNQITRPIHSAMTVQATVRANTHAATTATRVASKIDLKAYKKANIKFAQSQRKLNEATEIEKDMSDIAFYPDQDDADRLSNNPSPLHGQPKHLADLDDRIAEIQLEALGPSVPKRILRNSHNPHPPSPPSAPAGIPVDSHHRKK